MMRPLRWVILAATVLTLCSTSNSYANIPRPVRITEVYVAPPGALAGNQKVEITNLGTEPAILDGWCLRSTNHDAMFPEGTLLFPGDVLTVHIGALGSSDDRNVYTGPAFPTLRIFWGSLELHRPADEFNAESLVDYVNWGGPHHLNAPMAVGRGFWLSGDFLPGYSAVGISYQLCNGEQPGSDSWEVGIPSMGALNDCLLIPVPVEATTWGKVKARYAN